MMKIFLEGSHRATYVAIEETTVRNTTTFAQNPTQARPNTNTVAQQNQQPNLGQRQEIIPASIFQGSAITHGAAPEDESDADPSAYNDAMWGSIRVSTFAKIRQHKPARSTHYSRKAGLELSRRREIRTASQ